MGERDKIQNKNESVCKHGQAAQLNKIIKETYCVVGLGIILLVIFTAANIWASAVNAEQLESTMYLNQYRLGSKTLTSSVQSYAVTGDELYYNNYFKELNEDKNRDVAWEGLKNNDITKEEWAQLEHIAEMSDTLVPLEEQAMLYTATGSLKTAMNLVFGEEYENTVQEINALTDECITSIQERISRKQSIINVAMYISEILFILSFFYIVKKIADTTKFSKKELLMPIVKVSEQMTELAKGAAEGAGETRKLIEMTVEEVGKGITIADITAENMSEVMVGAKETTDKMKQMADELREEANHMYEIDENVSKVAEIVDNNSATSEETAAVSQEQTAQVATMVQLLSQFKI